MRLIGLLGLVIAVVMSLTTLRDTPSAPAAEVLAAAVVESAQSDTSRSSLLPLDDFSPQFLGMYRKSMTIEDEVRRYTDQYEVDIDLARAVTPSVKGQTDHLVVETAALMNRMRHDATS